MNTKAYEFQIRDLGYDFLYVENDCLGKLPSEHYSLISVVQFMSKNASLLMENVTSLLVSSQKRGGGLWVNERAMDVSDALDSGAGARSRLAVCAAINNVPNQLR
jgi:hypothetical protein